jgi:hypothetical protein
VIAKSALRKSAGVVSVLAVVNALAAGSVASGAPSTTLQLSHTIHFITSGTSAAKVGGNHTVDTSKLAARRTGRTIGSGVFSCVPSSSDSRVLKCSSAFALSDGILLGRETIKLRANTLSGSVTDGTGKYKGATGTIKGAGIGHSGDADVTVTYSTG